MVGERPEQSSTSEPATVFSLLGNETRLEIITALSEADATPVAFSTLFESLSLADSGQFNYHLDKLLGRFVSKDDAGYRLTSAGRRVARAVAAGFYTDSTTVEPFAIEGACLHCGEAGLEATYRDEQFHVDCGACGEQILAVAAPPSLVHGRSPEGALAAFERWAIRQVQLADEDDLCPYCAGPVERTVRTHPERPNFGVLPSFECQVCGGSVVTSFGVLAADIPTVQAFRERHGLGAGDGHYWEDDLYVTDEHVAVVSEDPWRVEVTIPAETAVCRVVMDDSHEVHSLEITVRE